MFTSICSFLCINMEVSGAIQTCTPAKKWKAFLLAKDFCRALKIKQHTCFRPNKKKKMPREVFSSNDDDNFFFLCFVFISLSFVFIAIKIPSIYEIGFNSIYLLCISHFTWKWIDLKLVSRMRLSREIPGRKLRKLSDDAP